jgi:hypothetical protein
VLFCIVFRSSCQGTSDIKVTRSKTKSEQLQNTTCHQLAQSKSDIKVKRFKKKSKQLQDTTCHQLAHLLADDGNNGSRINRSNVIPSVVIKEQLAEDVDNGTRVNRSDVILPVVMPIKDQSRDNDISSMKRKYEQMYDDPSIPYDDCEYHEDIGRVVVFEHNENTMDNGDQTETVYLTWADNRNWKHRVRLHGTDLCREDDEDRHQWTRNMTDLRLPLLSYGPQLHPVEGIIATEYCNGIEDIKHFSPSNKYRICSIIGTLR